MHRILIVDDDKNLRALYEQELAEEGYAVVLAASGPEALKCLRAERPDLIVLDIGMPGMDGMDLLTRILALDRSIPIVINTAYSIYRDNFLTWSADAFLVKTGDLSALKAKIQELLRAHDAGCRT